MKIYFHVVIRKLVADLIEVDKISLFAIHHLLTDEAGVEKSVCWQFTCEEDCILVADQIEVDKISLFAIHNLFTDEAEVEKSVCWQFTCEEDCILVSDQIEYENYSLFGDSQSCYALTKWNLKGRNWPSVSDL